MTGKNDPVVMEKAVKVLPWFIAVNILVWTGFGIAAGVMFVSLGAWPWVVWPFTFYWWLHHVGRKIEIYRKAKNPPKWEQNIELNVYPEAGLTGEQIAAAAERAVNEKLLYGQV